MPSLADYNALKAANITEMEVPFSGESNEGWMQEPEAKTADNTPVELSKELAKSIEDYCYACLEAKFPGWEINEGSDGRFHFDVAARTVRLEIGQRRTITDESVEQL